MDHKRETAPAGDRRGSEIALADGASGTLIRPTQGNPQVVGHVQKNSRERVRVALDAFNGRSYLDLRIVVQAEDQRLGLIDAR